MGRPQRESRRAHRSHAASGLFPVKIFAGRIVDVDPVLWTCIIKTEEPIRTFRDVPIGSSYLHPWDGEGIHFMPEAGAPVWVAQASDGGRPFIAGFRPYSQKGVTSTAYPNRTGVRTNRPAMQPGDIFLQTRDRNGLRLRRGQVTEIFGSPLSRTLFLGRTGTIHSLCQNFKLDTLSGTVRWTVERAEKDSEGKQGTVLAARIKEYANHAGHVVRLDAGGQLEIPSEGDTDGEAGTYGAAPQSAELVNSPVLRLRIFQDGDKKEEELEEAISLALDKDGQVELAQKGALHVEIRGSSNVTLKLQPDGTVELDTDSDYTVTSGGNHVHEVGAGKTHTIKAAGSTTEAVILGETFIQDLNTWMVAFTTMLGAMAADTTMSPGCAAAASAMATAHAQFQAQVAAALAAKAPYLSQVTETE